MLAATAGPTPGGHGTPARTATTQPKKSSECIVASAVSSAVKCASGSSNRRSAVIALQAAGSGRGSATAAAAAACAPVAEDSVRELLSHVSCGAAVQPSRVIPGQAGWRSDPAAPAAAQRQQRQQQQRRRIPSRQHEQQQALLEELLQAHATAHAHVAARPASQGEEQQQQQAPPPPPPQALPAPPAAAATSLKAAAATRQQQLQVHAKRAGTMRYQHGGQAHLGGQQPRTPQSWSDKLHWTKQELQQGFQRDSRGVPRSPDGTALLLSSATGRPARLAVALSQLLHSEQRAVVLSGVGPSAALTALQALCSFAAGSTPTDGQQQQQQQQQQPMVLAVPRVRSSRRLGGRGRCTVYDLECRLLSDRVQPHTLQQQQQRQQHRRHQLQQLHVLQQPLQDHNNSNSRAEHAAAFGMMRGGNGPRGTAAGQGSIPRASAQLQVQQAHGSCTVLRAADADVAGSHSCCSSLPVLQQQQLLLLSNELPTAAEPLHIMEQRDGYACPRSAQETVQSTLQSTSVPQQAEPAVVLGVPAVRELATHGNASDLADELQQVLLGEGSAAAACVHVAHAKQAARLLNAAALLEARWQAASSVARAAGHAMPLQLVLDVRHSGARERTHAVYPELCVYVFALPRTAA